MSHTKGPWSYWSGCNPMDNFEAQITAENGEVVIANYNHLIREGESNAALIASSPELLEVAELASIAMGNLICPADIEFGILKRLRATIRRARGEP